LLPRIEVIVDKSGGTSLNHDTVFFQKDTMYQHSIMHINYTTYDVRRSQDILNPKTDHRDILLLSPKPDVGHQYQYARIIGIYHVNLIYNNPTTHQYCTQRMDFLWVRYLKPLDNRPVQKGWTLACLDQLQFSPTDNPDAFGFVDPAQVVRACHLIPKFALGQHVQVNGNLRLGSQSQSAEDSRDWRVYYANR
jgi:hypothetical protein